MPACWAASTTRVQVTLQRGEGAVDRQRARDVGGVEVAALDAHVEQQQLSGRDRTAVLRPVQGRRVRPARHDRVVAQVVAHRAGPPEEGALEPPLAVLQHVVPLADAVGEAECRDVAGLLELAELPGVLDQPQLGEHPREVVVAPAVVGDGPVDVRVDAAQHTGLGRPRRDARRAHRGAAPRARASRRSRAARGAGRPTARRSGGPGRTRRSAATSAGGRRARTRRPR